MLDPDDAGERATEKISKRLDKYFHVKRISNITQDPGDMPIEVLKKEICS
jgi:5S rRNA maturation endonuclease (ribonuclease M5)